MQSKLGKKRSYNKKHVFFIHVCNGKIFAFEITLYRSVWFQQSIQSYVLIKPRYKLLPFFLTLPYLRNVENFEVSDFFYSEIF